MSAMAAVVYREMRKKETKIAEEPGMHTNDVQQNMSMAAEKLVPYGDNM